MLENVHCFLNEALERWPCIDEFYRKRKKRVLQMRKETDTVLSCLLFDIQALKSQTSQS
jgi:hypothetical protein